jgi:hypothetical protein
MADPTLLNTTETRMDPDVDSENLQGRSGLPATREMHVGALFLATQHLGPGELAVLVTIAQRLEMGRQQYGDLDPVRDRRNWRKELAEEQLDAAVYAACEVIRAEALGES